MKSGDSVIIYHSNAEPSGVAGLASISRIAEPDQTQFDPKSEYFDPKASRSAPRWYCPKVAFQKRFSGILSLEELRGCPALEGLLLLQRGSRLSVIPVEAAHFKKIVQLADRVGR
jgi:predicted RNA-binding protein with PUA-like domain